MSFVNYCPHRWHISARAAGIFQVYLSSPVKLKTKNGWNSSCRLAIQEIKFLFLIKLLISLKAMLLQKTQMPQFEMWCPNPVGRRKRPLEPFIIDYILAGQFKVILLMFLPCLLLKTSSPNKKSQNTGQVMLSPENKRQKPETLPGIYLHYTLAVLCSPEESINSVNRSLLEPLAAMRGYMVQTLSRSVTAALCRHTHSPDEPEYSQRGFADTCQAATWASLTPRFWIMCSWAWDFQTLLQPLSHERRANSYMGEYTGELTICYPSLQFDSINNKTGYS